MIKSNVKVARIKITSFFIMSVRLNKSRGRRTRGRSYIENRTSSRNTCLQPFQYTWMWLPSFRPYMDMFVETTIILMTRNTTKSTTVTFNLTGFLVNEGTRDEGEIRDSLENKVVWSWKIEEDIE